METRTETATSLEIDLKTEENPRTLDDLVRVCNIDLETWEIERWVANKWEMGYKNQEKQAESKPLFQIKVWLKKRLLAIAVRDEISDLLATTKESITTFYGSKKTNASQKNSNFSGLMLEPSIPDLHAGKLAWGKETGDANYDTKIAREVFEQALETLVSRVGGMKFEQILFPVGNDLLNSDNISGTTTAGTPQTTDGRYQKTFQMVRLLMCEAVERLRTMAPVHVVMVPGNHDQLGVWCLGHSLECYFHTYPDVTVDNMPRTRKYYQWGKNMLMFTHGDKGKKTNYPLLMASEEPEMWAATTYREAHCGHLHKTSTEVDEFYGVRTRISPALCPADAWHSEQGYVGQGRGAEAFVWDKEQGLVNMAFFSVN